MPKGVKPPNAGKGRPKGSPNKAKARAKEAFALLVEGNVSRVQGWLDAVATQHGPLAALKCFLELTEFHVPKLARTEMSGPDGAAIPITQIRHNYVGLPPPSPERDPSAR